MINLLDEPKFPQTWQEAFASLFSTAGLVLTLVSAMSFVFEQILTELLQNEILNPNGTTPFLWVYGGLSFALSLLSPIVMSFLAICAWRCPNQTVGFVARRSFSYLIREEMRSLGKSLAWGLLLILPGLIRFFQLAFVPYVVLLEQGYQEGRIDALELSSKYVRRVWLRLLGLLFFFGLVCPLLFTLLDDWRSILRNPLTAAPLWVAELTIVLIFQWLLLKTWERAHEFDISRVRDSEPQPRIDV